MIVRSLLHQLRAHVERRALDRGKNHRVETHCSREPEVAQLHDTSLAKKDVLRLHIAVENAVGMQVEEGRHELASDPSDLGQRKRKSNYN